MKHCTADCQGLTQTSSAVQVAEAKIIKWAMPEENPVPGKGCFTQKVKMWQVGVRVGIYCGLIVLRKVGKWQRTTQLR